MDAEDAINGEATVDLKLSHDDDDSQILKQKIDSLEAEKASLLTECAEAKEKAKNLSREVEIAKSKEEELRARIETELEGFDESKRTLEQVAKRNVELETDIFRLQHDLITAMHAGEEISAEAMEFQRLLGEAEVKLEEEKKDSAELGRNLRDLEKKAGVLEARESAEKSKCLRLEEETKMKEMKIKELEDKLGVAESQMKALKERSSGAQKLNGIEIGSRDVGINASRVIGSVGGAVLVVAAVSAIVFFAKSRKA